MGVLVVVACHGGCGGAARRADDSRTSPDDDHRHRRAGEALAQGHAVERRRCSTSATSSGWRRPTGSSRCWQLVPNVLVADEPRRADDPRPEQHRRARRASRRSSAARGRGRCCQIDGRTATFNEFVEQHRRAVGRRPCRGVPKPADDHPGRRTRSPARSSSTPPIRPSSSRAKRGLIVGQSRRRQLSAAVSGPLIDDQLALSGSRATSTGAGRSTQLSGPVVGIADLNTDRYWTTARKLLAQPHALPGLQLACDLRAQPLAGAARRARRGAPLPPAARDALLLRLFQVGRGFGDGGRSPIVIATRLEIADDAELGTSAFPPFRAARVRPNSNSRPRPLARDGARVEAGGAAHAVGGSQPSADGPQSVHRPRAASRWAPASSRITSAAPGCSASSRGTPADTADADRRRALADRQQAAPGVLRWRPRLPLDYDRDRPRASSKVSAAYDLTERVCASACSCSAPTIRAE